MRGNLLSTERPSSRAMRSVSPESFALVMATGIVSAAVREVGLEIVGGVMLGIAAAAFVAIAGASCVRAVLAPAAVRADLTVPNRAFASFGLVAACAVLGNGLSDTGYRVAAEVLAWTGLAAWLALTGAVPVRLALGRQARPRLDDVNGTWYLWAVATQSLSISASFLRSDEEVPARIAQLFAIALWSAGVAIYLAISILVVLRLRAGGLGPKGLRAPYWIAMGAASISVLAAARILGGPGMAAGSAGRAVVVTTAVTLWLVATGLMPVLAAITAGLSLRWPPRLRYWPGAWTIVFPLGMYAVASAQLGMRADLPLLRGIGQGEAWVAWAAWVLTFALVVVAARPPWHRPRAAARPRRRRRPPQGRPPEGRPPEGRPPEGRPPERLPDRRLPPTRGTRS
jgi:tellurite resistance protein TehA-like permease